MRTSRSRSRTWLQLAACGLTAASLATAEVPPEARERYLEILRSKGTGSYESALARAQQLASEHPELEAVHRTLADLFILLEDEDRGRRYFRDRIEQHPDAPYGYYGLGRLDFHEGALDGAMAWYERALAADPGFAEVYGLHRGLPRIYEAQRDLEAAIAYFNDLTMSSPENANAWSGLGWSSARSFDFDEAIPAFLRALELDPEHVQTHHGLVQSYSRMGRFQKSLESCDALTRAARQRGDFEMLVYADMMRGTIAYRRGDYRTALSNLRMSHKLAQEIGDTFREATIVNNIAVVHATGGDYEKALPYFEISLELSEQKNVNALRNIGNVHKLAGRYDRAIESYRKVAEIERDAGFRRDLSSTLANMAEAFHLRGDVDTALRYYDEALQLAEETENTIIQAFVSGLLGKLHRDRGRYADAIAHFERQLAIGERTGEAQPIWEAQAGLGSTYEKLGDPEEAIAHYAEAIARYDAIRESLALESRGSAFLEDKYHAYASIVRLLAAQDDLESAFEYAEKYKAKGFLDILARGHTLFETQLPEDLRLELDRIQSELQKNHAARSRQSDVPLEERITELELRRAEIVDRVRREHGDFYALALSEPVEVTTLQSSVLEPGQILIEYVIGDECLSILVVSRDELRYREVTIGREALRRQLSELSPLFDSDEPRTRFLNPELADFSLPPARALYDTLLAPVEEWLPENAELIIVPDDFLFYLPFELLVAETEGAEHRYDFSAATFVVERYAVSYAPSASVLDPALQRPRRFERGVLAFGNPAFDPALEEQPPLPSSEREVEAIEAAFAGYENSVLTGDEATEAAFAREAARYGVLHFATHFTSDDRQPLYSQILLADDVLQTYEIFDAELNAELAVLSACNTGLGKLAKGEGLIGISRAFLYAGVPSLVVSLWSVDDDATARIMESFYEHLRSGTSKKQALRRAKLDYLEAVEGDARDPFYWAPFILSGNWHPLNLPPPDPPAWLSTAAGGLLLLGAVFLWRRRRSPS